MIRRKTTFIIGAGASNEVGLPIGCQLVTQIADLLNIRFDFDRKKSGSDLIVQALRVHCESDGEKNINSHLSAGWAVRDAAPISISIDNYIDAHRGDRKIELCAKLAIVEALLAAEKKSALYPNANEPRLFDLRRFDLAAVNSTWYTELFKVLSEGVDKPETLFENVSFILFNYDRCLEHFLKQALEVYYRLNGEDAVSLLKKAKFIHPYGTVGSLDWQETAGISFGASVGAEKLLAAARSIRTFTEQEQDSQIQSDIAEEMQSAETLIFLGFAFHGQNLQLLKPDKGRARRIYGTAYKMSQPNCDASTDHLRYSFWDSRYNDIVALKDVKCSQLFLEYFKHFGSA